MEEARQTSGGKKAKHKEWWDRVDESAEGYQEVN